MTQNVAQIESLIKELNTADFCKVVNSSIRSRAANESAIREISSSVQEAIAVSRISTPAATPAADIDRDSNETTDLPATDDDNVSLENCGHCQGLGKRSKHATTIVLGNDHELTKVQKIFPKPLQDLYNFWSLCMVLRGRTRPVHETQLQLPWAEQLPRLLQTTLEKIENAHCKAALHTLEWRLLVIEIASMYIDEKSHEDKRKCNMLAMGHKVAQNRDVTLDWLTGKLYGAAVNIYKLSSNDERRKKVEHWLRVGCPLFAFTKHCGFACLIAPGMRIPQVAFKAKHAGDTDTPFVRHLINTFGGSKDRLSFLSDVMESWVRTSVPPDWPLKIEELTESEVRSQINPSLECWGQFTNLPPCSGNAASAPLFNPGPAPHSLETTANAVDPVDTL